MLYGYKRKLSFRHWNCAKLRPKAKNNILVSRNAGDEKNLHQGGRKSMFLNPFFGDILFSFVLSLAFFVFFFFFACLFIIWKWKYIFWYTFDYAGGWVTMFFVFCFFHPADFGKEDYFFWPEQVRKDRWPRNSFSCLYTFQNQEKISWRLFVRGLYFKR